MEGRQFVVGSPRQVDSIPQPRSDEGDSSLGRGSKFGEAGDKRWKQGPIGPCTRLSGAEVMQSWRLTYRQYLIGATFMQGAVNFWLDRERHLLCSQLEIEIRRPIEPPHTPCAALPDGI